ncbi:MAG: protein kinase [Deltaproteobacteria bacterium]|jgi:serine/threonine-protein kinase|nr:protein kinase [Deltaproteobacteria bacterium]MBW2532321.1 protein kinase [Deltaproteobacteria bacterium]
MGQAEFDWEREFSGAVRPGDLVAGKYRIEALAGVGGMGIVVTAWHAQIGERVAVKFLKPARLTNPTARQRFDREAQAAFRIRSEHVVRVHDMGKLDEGLPYMVMEYLEGRSLKQVLNEQGPLAIGTAALYVHQACDAIGQAHALGIVHRDLKPANLFLTHRADGSPCVKVLDFGIAKAKATHGSLTSAHRSLGTPKYMSPEQWLSAREASARTDIWALGAILFELVAGRSPFQTFNPDELRTMVLMSPAPSLLEVCPDAPAGLAAAVARCLERSPQNRFEDVAALGEALTEFAASPRDLAQANTGAGDSSPPEEAAVEAGPMRFRRPIRKTAEHVPPMAAPEAEDPTTLNLDAEQGRSVVAHAVARAQPSQPVSPEADAPIEGSSLDDDEPTRDTTMGQPAPTSTRGVEIPALVAASDRLAESAPAATAAALEDDAGLEPPTEVDRQGESELRRRPWLILGALGAAIALGVCAGGQWGEESTAESAQELSDLAADTDQAPPAATSPVVDTGPADPPADEPDPEGGTEDPSAEDEAVDAGEQPDAEADAKADAETEPPPRAQAARRPVRSWQPRRPTRYRPKRQPKKLFYNPTDL